MTVLSPHNVRLWLHLVRDLLVDTGPTLRVWVRRLTSVLPVLLAIGIPAAIVAAAWALPTTQVRGFLIAVVELGALGMLITLLVLVVMWLSRTETRIRLTPFEVSDAVADQHGLDGRIIADQLGVALQRIRQTHQRYAGENLDGRHGPAPSSLVDRPWLDPGERAKRRRERDVLAAPGGSLSPDLPDVGSVAVAGAQLSLSNLLLTLKRLWPLGDSGPLVSGSVGVVGHTAHLVARLEKRRGARSIPGEFRNRQTVKAELHRIACAIQYELVRERLSAKSPEAFRYFTDALTGFADYQRLVGEVRHAEAAGADGKANRLATAALQALDQAEATAFQAVAAQPEDETGDGTKRYREAQALLVRIADEHYRYQRTGQAAALLEKLRQEDPTLPEAWTGLGQLRLDADDPDGALPLFGAAARLSGHTWWTLTDLGTAYSALDRDAEARRCFQRAVERAPTVPGPWLTLGDHHQLRGEYAEAGRCYRRARMAERTEPAGLLRLADLHLRFYRTRQARRCYLKLARSAAGNPEVWRGLGLVSTEERDVDRGRQYFALATEVGNGWAAPYADLGDLYQRVRRYDDAVAAYHRCLGQIRADRDDPNLLLDVHLAIARSYLRQARLAEAEHHLDVALRTGRDSPTVWLEEGERRRLHHDTDGARHAYLLAAELGPDGWTGPLTRLAALEAEAGNRDLALELCGRAIETDPSDDWACGTLGGIYWTYGEYAAAVRHHRRAAKLNPREATHWINQGVNLGEQGRYGAAEACFRRAVKADQGDPDVSAWWADLALRSGDLARAAGLYRQATEDLPRHSFEEQVRLAAIARVRGDQPAERAATDAAWAVRDDAWRLRLASDADLLEFTALLHLLAADRDAALGSLRGARARLVGPAGFLSVRLGVYDLLAAAPMPEFFDEYRALLPPVRVRYAQRAATGLLPVSQRPTHVGPPITGRDADDWSTRDEPVAVPR